MTTRQGSKQRIIAIALLACAVALICGAVWWTNRPATPAATSSASAMPSATAMQQSPQATVAPTAQSSFAPTVTDEQGLSIIHAQQHRDPSDARAKGSVDAPVVMVLYSDFSCPYCTRLAKQVEPQLEDLVANGTLRIEWRDLAQISQSSPLAAQAGIAADTPNTRWIL